MTGEQTPAVYRYEVTGRYRDGRVRTATVTVQQQLWATLPPEQWERGELSSQFGTFDAEGWEILSASGRPEAVADR